MNSPVRLAIDAMSGDRGLQAAAEAAILALRAHAALQLVMVGDESQLRQAMPAEFAARVEFEHADEIVGMDEPPSKALRHKRNSSMRRAIDLLKEGRVRAVVSAGNTGALMAMARFVLKTLPGIDRPAIMSPLPTVRGYTHMLDLGANADCSAEQLYQFAMMGAAAVEAAGTARPRVALLNIGEEEIKGNEVIKQTAAMLTSSSLNYVGYVEGNDVFLKPVDVVVCDGFVGNVALKTCEGVAKLIGQFMREEFTRNPLTKIAALMARPVLAALQRRIDPRHYNGASLLGLQGIVIKSHGSADALAFSNAIEVAMREVERDIPARISHMLAAQSPASKEPVPTSVVAP